MMVIPTEHPVEDDRGQRARSTAGQAVTGPARSSPGHTVVAWLLRRLGSPPPPPRCHFSKAVYYR
jgi:hypothetical protein